MAYFFATEFNEMEYEIVKQRPKLTDAFFAHLLEAKAAGDEALEALEAARREAVAGSKAEPVSKTAASARAPAAPPREARRTRPRLIVPRPLCSR